MTKKRTPIDELSGDFLDAMPISYDWRDNLDGYTPYEAVECPGDDCGHEFVAVGVGPVCPKCGEEQESAYGPAMNYYYPVSLRWGMMLEDAANRISQLPLCMVELRDGSVGMALTGGGMDLSWEIIRAYIALGFLPPIHFLPPPGCPVGNVSSTWSTF